MGKPRVLQGREPLLHSDEEFQEQVRNHQECIRQGLLHELYACSSVEGHEPV